MTPNNTLEILIKLGVIGKEDAAAVQDLLQETGKSTDDLSKKTKAAAGASQEHNEHLHESRLLFNELNRIVPGLGHLLHAAFAGPVGPAIALASVVFEIKRSIDETNKSLDGMAAKAAEASFLSGIESKIGTLNAATEAAAGYAQKLAEMKTGEHGIAEELQKQLGLDQAIERARAGLVSAQKGLDIARVQEGENSGRLSPGKAAEAKATIEKNYNEQVQRDREAAQNKEMLDKQNALISATNQQANLEAAQHQAATAQSMDTANRERLKSDFGNTDKFLGDQQAAQKELDAANEELRIAKRNSFGVRGTKGSSANAEWSAAERNISLAEAKLKSLRSGREQYESTQTPDSLGAAAVLKEQSDRATTAANKNAEAIGTLTAELAQLRSVIAATRPVEQTTVGVQNKTIDTTEKIHTEDRIKRDVDTIHSFEKNKSVSPETISRAAAAIRDLNETLASHAEFISFAATLGMNVRSLRDAQNELAREVSLLREQGIRHNEDFR